MNQFSLSPQISKYKISRRGRKLQISDDPRTIIALPKDVSEKTWAEILQKEESDLVVLDVREEIVEEALRIGYEHYMERQLSPFTVHCTTEAWLKLIDWYFYRHDPGEEPSAYPPCYIPKRLESWQSDQLPDSSPKDTWLKQELAVVEDTSEEPQPRCASSTSLDYPVVEEIPQEYWFPGKVNLQGYESTIVVDQDVSSVSYVWRGMQYSGLSDSVQEESRVGDLTADSEMLQKVTDYSDHLSKKESQLSGMKNTTPVEGSLQGAGDSNVNRQKKKYAEKSKVFSRASVGGRSRGVLPPLDSRSRISTISDCRLRNLRLDTQYEISSEKIDTPPGEIVKRK